MEQHICMHVIMSQVMNLAAPGQSQHGARWHTASVIPVRSGEKLEFYVSNGFSVGTHGYQEDRPSSSVAHDKQGKLYKLATMGA
jgi:hypothetical protein